MNREPANQILSRAEALYRMLLFVYPTNFRCVYGQQMAQTFRDCCRNMLREQKRLDLVSFWCPILCDLAITASLEHVRSLMTFFRHSTDLEKEFLMASILSLDVAALTDIGRTRPTNEDNVASVIPQDPQMMMKKGALFIAADGLGGKAKGDVASETAVTVIRDTYYQDENSDILSSLQQAVEKANKAVYQRNAELYDNKEDLEKKGMGTTCVAAVLKEDSVYVANAGDSLAYIVHNSQVRQISQNHSWLAEQVREGKMTQAEAESQGKGNLITRCLGIDLKVKIYAASEQVKDGDILVLCTDGLHGLVSEEEIRATVEQYGTEESATRLIARANENGGPDNITVVVVRVALSEA